jgi:hypothetical protein
MIRLDHRETVPPTAALICQAPIFTAIPWLR